MKPTKLQDLVKFSVVNKRPIFIEGKPGIGKSSIVRAVAKAMDLELRDVRAILLDPVDFRGLPYVVDGSAKVAVPAWLPSDGAGIIFLDELNAAPHAVQAASYQLVLDRAVGEYRLPDGWAVIAAGNGAADGAVVNRMGTALRSRFIQVQLEVDLDDWTGWAIGADMAPELIACVRFRPNLLDGFDKNAKAFSCPRTLEFAAQVLAAKMPADIEHEALTGCVGEGAAAEISGFMRVYRQLPSIDGIMIDPKGTKVPESPAAQFAVVGALAHRTTNANVDAVMQYITRLPAEFQVIYVRDARQRSPLILNERAMMAWFAKHHQLLS